MLYLDKLLTQIAYPLNLSLWLSLLALLLLWLHWRRSGLTILVLAVAWLWVWSLPVVSDALRLSLEGRFANVPVEQSPTAEAVVLLGGGVSGTPSQWPYADLGSGADRVWHAARLYHAGKAPVVVVSGGGAAWRGERRSEAEAIAQFLRALGVPDRAMLLENASRTTYENAVLSAQLLEKRNIGRVLLVTSALHMTRAAATFRSAGVDLVPAPADFEVIPEPNHLLRWLPDAEALSDSTRALKEYLGLAVYRWRGWAGE
ncbi:YdcF family protein [Thiohalomonas denitrificans]|uniref:Uncharacterized SAM-binding protein YcdF, DUF218 family n=1 Tax=Thiohalomonas denitrificans TaxID=415747 RepID=A0A1G5R157_9GAMM|nr:YdcF family protein [Thiohalomonas denitrificans]SCZ67211.1 Uncharacterized SAM-binding protein YcdF, DUF218 family [Thiohalomonas denitrificans]